MNKYIASLILLLSLVLLTCFPAWSAEKGFLNKTIAYQDNLVPAGQTVRNVLLIGKNGIIAGNVEDEVIVINGSVTIKKTAKVADRVFVVGGDIIQEPGAKVGKGVFNFSTSHTALNSLILGALAFCGLELVKLFLNVFIILASVLVGMVAPQVVAGSAQKLKGSFLKSVVMGIIGVMTTIILIAVLATSFWGIPLALVLLLLALVLLIIGCAGMSKVFGELIKNGTKSSINSPLAITAAGTLLLIAMLNLPLLGPIWGLVLIVSGFGSTLLLISQRKV